MPIELAFLYLFLVFCFFAYRLDPTSRPLLERLLTFLERNSREMLIATVVLSALSILGSKL